LLGITFCAVMSDSSIHQKCAHLIQNATFLVVGAGAGMSADSGLLVYGQVSETDFFKKHNLTYRDVSDPTLLVKNPDLFNGWTACCVTKYRSALPHKGYSILREWKEKFLVTSERTEKLRAQIKTDPFRPIPANGSLPDNFFIYTTNVDGFFLRAGFGENEVCQVHGTYDKFQCSGIRRTPGPSFKNFDGPCKLETWNIPRDFEFLFDEQSMVAPPGNPKKASPDTKWQENHPKCPHCGKLSRPNVYMFGDQCFVENIYENTNWLNWSHAVKALLKQNKDISLVMLELGVGIRLPKVRVAFERLLLECPPRQAKIIRVNPEFQQTIEKGLNPEDLICLSEGALSALEKINTYIK